MLQCTHELDRRGGGPGVELLEAREVEALEVALEDARPDQRDRIEPIRASALDRREQGLGRGRTDEGDLAARLPGRQREREGRHVEERKHADRALGRVAEDPLEAPQPARAVREHDPLGPSGAPAREEEHVRVALAESRLGYLVLPDVLEAEPRVTGDAGRL